MSLGVRLPVTPDILYRILLLLLLLFGAFLIDIYFKYFIKFKSRIMNDMLRRELVVSQKNKYQ